MNRDQIRHRLNPRQALVALAAASLLGGCVIREEPETNRWGYGGTEYAAPQTPPPPPPPSGPPEGPPDYPPSSQAGTGPATPPANIPPVEPAQSAIPWGIPVEGKPGFIRSPYSPGGGQIDVRGFPPGTEIKDPYNPGKLLLVP